MSQNTDEPINIKITPEFQKEVQEAMKTAVEEVALSIKTLPEVRQRFEEQQKRVRKEIASGGHHTDGCII